MVKEGNIVRFTHEELDEIRAKDGCKTDWAKVDAITEEELERLIVEGGEEEGFPIDPDWSQIILGHPDPKKMVNLRLDGDIIRWFKEGGKGYQTRINAVLRAYYEHEKRKARGMDPSLPAYSVGLKEKA